MARQVYDDYREIVTGLLVPSSLDYRERFLVDAFERLLSVELKIAQMREDFARRGLTLPEEWAQAQRNAEMLKLQIANIRLETERWHEAQRNVHTSLQDIFMSTLQGADAVRQSVQRFITSVVELWLQRRLEQAPFLRELSEWFTVGVTGQPAPMIGLVQTGVAAVDAATQRTITNLQLLQSQLSQTGSVALQAWGNIAGFISAIGAGSLSPSIQMSVPSTVSENLLRRTQQDWAEVLRGQRALPVAIVGVGGGAVTLPAGSTPTPQNQRRPNWAQRAMQELMRFGAAWSLFQTMRESQDPLTGAIAGGMLASLFTSNPFFIGIGAILGAFGLFRRRRRPPTPPPTLYQPPQQFYASPVFMLPTSSYFGGRAPSALAPITIHISQTFNASVDATVAQEFRSGATTLARQLALEIRRGLQR